MTTLCGKCGKRVLESGEPAGLLGSPVCDCADLAIRYSQTANEEREPLWDGELEFRDAIGEKLEEHRVRPNDKRKLCAVCTAMGSTFGCMKCNAGPTNIGW
jgi:hypothetical protein